MTTDAALKIADHILAPYKDRLGENFDGYRNHVFRIIRLSDAFDFGPCSDLLGVAAAYHDIAVWTHQTLDYLEPSVELALQDARLLNAPDEDRRLVASAIRQHHKIFAWRGSDRSAVEAFRKADWTDLSRGLLRFGLKRGVVTALRAQYPESGFLKSLLRAFRKWAAKHPWSILPMMKL